MKFFNKDENGYRTLVEWDKGYIKFVNDWRQFKKKVEWNWLTFRPITIEIEFDRMCHERLSIEVCVLGVGIYFQQQIKENEYGRKLVKQAEEIVSIEENHQTEIDKLKKEIKELKRGKRKSKKA